VKSRSATPHIGIFQVAAGLDDIERGLLEHLGDRRGIVGRIGQCDDVLVVGVTDDERNALVRKSGLVGETNDHNRR